VADRSPDDLPTRPVPFDPDGLVDIPDASTIRLFNSPSFFRLWLGQVVSSIGDWLGFVAITALAARIGGSSPEAAISLVLSARLVPGFFFGPIAGVFVDRWDRKRTMVVCDVGRGLVLATLPFVDTIPGLVVASLLMETFTLMWGPARDASVPNLVQPEFLPQANSLSLVAAYGTFPIGSAVFALLAKVAEWLGGYEALEGLRINQESVAIYVDVFTFFLSALMVSTLPISRAVRSKDTPAGRADMKQTFRELAEGWQFISTNGIVRAVIFGIATGLFGGGMLVPLGPIFSKEVLGAGPSGFGLLLTALGVGMAVGIVGLSVTQRHLNHQIAFVGSLIVGGAMILLGASMSTLAPALGFVAVLGVCAGGVYVLGYSILGAAVEDDLRGRIFATLYTSTRLTILMAFALAPVLSRLLDALSNQLFDGEISFGGSAFGIPGVRLTLWLGGLIILFAGFVAFRNVKAVAVEESS
jgi:MFS family permease